MSRHRNIRVLDVDDEYEGYYSCYGHSVEDDFCISPQTEAQFLYNRDSQQLPISNFLSSEVVPEEDDSNLDFQDKFENNHDSILKYSLPQSPVLSSMDYAKLQSCIEAMQDVVGDTISDDLLKKSALDNQFDVSKSLNAVLERYEANTITSKLATGEKCDSEDTVMPCNITELCASENTVMTCNITEVSEKRERKNAVDVFHIYKETREKEKPLLNLVVIGHVDAGKSTLLGHLLFKLGCVPKKTMHKYEQESKKLGKASFLYAWVLDETLEERNRGITMDVAQSKFETPSRIVNVLDAPGHKDFIPNMITGAAQADVAILVVDSTCGEFETGFEAGGQTREHTLLVRSLGVSQMVVAINKMDNVNWEKQRYDEIIKRLSMFLKQVGFKDSDVSFVPCSGLTAENLMACTQLQLQKWYSGPTLIDVIDSFKPPQRPISKPLRMCINDVFKGITGGFCVSGKIEAGFVQNNDKLFIMPHGELATIKGITINDICAPHGFAGDHVVLQLSGIDVSNIYSGNILCDTNVPVKVTSCFEARLVIFNITTPITKGFPVVIHYQSFSEQAVIVKLISQLHLSTGDLIKKKPRCLMKHSSAVVEIEVSRPICVELYKDYKDLGRFMLRSAGSTIAAGLVTKINCS